MNLKRTAVSTLALLVLAASALVAVDAPAAWAAGSSTASSAEGEECPDFALALEQRSGWEPGADSYPGNAMFIRASRGQVDESEVPVIGDGVTVTTRYEWSQWPDGYTSGVSHLGPTTNGLTEVMSVACGPNRNPCPECSYWPTYHAFFAIPVASTDECGQDDWTRNVPDYPLGFDFTDPCSTHDRCRYQVDQDWQAGVIADEDTFRQRAYECHAGFRDLMYEECDNARADWGGRLGPVIGEIVHGYCMPWPAIYYDAVFLLNSSPGS